MNFRYFGPIDGHDVMHLTEVLRDLKRIPGPKLLHCLTVKGKGFRQAEEHQPNFMPPEDLTRIPEKLSSRLKKVPLLLTRKCSDKHP